MTNPSLERFPDLEAASRRAASLTASAAREAAATRGRFTLALSGGSTPGRFFELLAGEDLPWDRVHVFWADERLVGPDSPDSNYRLARERLLSKIPIPKANLHPMAGGTGLGGHARPGGEGSSGAMPGALAPSGELGGPGVFRGEGASPSEGAQAAARAYEDMLRGFFGGQGFPVFDVIHLGLGGDGHTASLFPGQPSLGERARWVLPVEYAKASPPVERLTLTLPVINAGRLVFFLVSGAAKAGLAGEISGGAGQRYPASLVRPAGRLVWLAAET